MFWLNLFLVPDYLWLIAEHFSAPEDDTRAMLLSCQPLKAALSAYLLEIRIMREVEIKVHDWFHLAACSTCNTVCLPLVMAEPLEPKAAADVEPG